MIISFVVGAALGYLFFYFRYDDVRGIDEMRAALVKAQQGHELSIQEQRELQAQNKILKTKTEQLIDQNEDYSKMISKLSRYYFHIKEANVKLDELKKVLQMFDDGLDAQLGHGAMIQDVEVFAHDGLKDLSKASLIDQKFF